MSMCLRVFQLVITDIPGIHKHLLETRTVDVIEYDISIDSMHDPETHESLKLKIDNFRIQLFCSMLLIKRRQ